MEASKNFFNKAPNKLTLSYSSEGCLPQGVFSRMEKPSDDINSRLFLMNKKGLKNSSANT
jgi:hypothetical protein